LQQYDTPAAPFFFFLVLGWLPAGRGSSAVAKFGILVISSSILAGPYPAHMLHKWQLPQLSCAVVLAATPCHASTLLQCVCVVLMLRVLNGFMNRTHQQSAAAAVPAAQHCAAAAAAAHQAGAELPSEYAAFRTPSWGF
jgi:hypothetical protein